MIEEPTVEIVVRMYHSKTDDAYIYSTWTKYAWYSPKEPTYKTKAEFFRDKIAEIKEALKNGLVHVACLKDAPSMIVGYVVVKDGHVKWSCVKKTYHEQGVEELLLKSMKGKLK